MGWQMVSFFMYLYCLLDAVMQEQVAIGQPFQFKSIFDLTRSGDHPHGRRCYSAEPTSGDKVLLTAPRPHSLRGEIQPISFD